MRFCTLSHELARSFLTIFAAVAAAGWVDTARATIGPKDVQVLVSARSHDPMAAREVGGLRTLGDFSTPVATLVSVTVTAENKAPMATNLSAAEIYTEDTALNLVDIVVSGVNNSLLTVTLTLSNRNAGGVSTGTSGAVTSTYEGSTGVWRAEGAIADVNILLADAVFNPAPNFNGSFTMAATVSDGIAPAVTGTKNFTGMPVNDAPLATNLSAAETYTEDTPLDLVDIVVSDIDTSILAVTLTLSNPGAGRLNTSRAGTVASTFNASTGVWKVVGPMGRVNSILSFVIFYPALNFNGDFTLATSVSDGDAAPVTGTKTFIGIPVNDAPTFSNIELHQAEAGGNQVHLYFVGTPGLTYRVEYTDSLALADWLPLNTIAGPQGQHEAIDQSPLPAQRFYRSIEK